MITLYLIRHGETTWNKSARYQGHTDVPLSEMGLKQAALTAEHFKDIHIDGVFTSPLSRAAVTAHGIAESHGLSLVKVPELQEMSFGDWEGKSFDEIDRLWPGMMEEMYHAPDGVEFPHGESFLTCQKRTMKFINELLQKGDNKSYVIVSHGVAIRTIICGMIDIPLARSWNLGLSNASITTIRHFVGEKNLSDLNLLYELNNTNHLGGASTPH